MFKEIKDILETIYRELKLKNAEHKLEFIH